MEISKTIDETNQEIGEPLRISKPHEVLSKTPISTKGIVNLRTGITKDVIEITEKKALASVFSAQERASRIAYKQAVKIEKAKL